MEKNRVSTISQHELRLRSHSKGLPQVKLEEENYWHTNPKIGSQNKQNNHLYAKYKLELSAAQYQWSQLMPPQPETPSMAFYFSDENLISICPISPSHLWHLQIDLDQSSNAPHWLVFQDRYQGNYSSTSIKDSIAVLEQRLQSYPNKDVFVEKDTVDTTKVCLE